MSQRLSSLAKPVRNRAVWLACLDGESQRAVARRFGISQRTVQRIVARQGETLPGGWGPPSKGQTRPVRASRDITEPRSAA